MSNSTDLILQNDICRRAERAEKHEENVEEEEYCWEHECQVTGYNENAHKFCKKDVIYRCSLCETDYEKWESAFNCCADEDIQI